MNFAQIKEKYCFDDSFSKSFESKEKAENFKNLLNTKHKDKLIGKAFVQSLAKPRGHYAVVYFSKNKIEG